MNRLARPAVNLRGDPKREIDGNWRKSILPSDTITRSLTKYDPGEYVQAK